MMNLQRTDDPAAVIRMQTGRTRRVHIGKPCMQGLRPVFFGKGILFAAECFTRHRLREAETVAQ
ncbi:hypothetical protein D3C75_1264440 [compost metagenome]